MYLVLLRELRCGFSTAVRLGELNLLTKTDCDDHNIVKVCSDPPVDVPVEKVIAHPLYNNQTVKNDIALLRLAKKVQFTGGLGSRKNCVFLFIYIQSVLTV